MIYHCCTERRRNAIRKHPDLNGIDFLEVRRQKVLLRPGIKQIFYKITLELHFLKALAPIQIAEKNILIKGGERIKNVQVKNIIQPIISTPPDGSEKVLQIELEQEGDFSIYELCLVEDNNKAELEILKGIDTQLSRIAFSFKVDCDANVDCKAEPIECVDQPTEVLPEINYLAKDYTSFKQLMYDRLAMLIPNWETPNPASIESTLVELLAYTADYLSYRQDAISTEAYLRTSRKRISVKRHARLVDYHMHDGCNARTWLHLQVIEGT
ncbi:MAG: putative baseplate assembly protein, partial [Bacteroidota bacterium]